MKSPPTAAPPSAHLAPRATRQRAHYQARLDSELCPVCGSQRDNNGILCARCQDRKRDAKRRHAPAFRRTCDGPCARTLRFTPTDPRTRIEHWCSTCGRVTAWVAVSPIKEAA